MTGEPSEDWLQFFSNGQSFFALAETFGDPPEPPYHLPIPPKPLRSVLSYVRLLDLVTSGLEDLPSDGQDDEETRSRCAESGWGFERERQRLTFWRDRIDADTDLLSLPDEALAGYAIVTTDRITYADGSTVPTTYVEEAFLPPTDEMYVHCTRKTEVKVAGRVFRIPGVFFRQQCGFLTCCVHASVISTFNQLTGNPTARCTPHRINDLLDVSIPPKHASVCGVHTNDVPRIVLGLGLGSRAFGFVRGTGPDGQQRLVAEYGQDEQPERAMTLQHIAYLAVESGFPVVLGFGLAGTDEAEALTAAANEAEVAVDEVLGHTAMIVGHTLSRRSWLAEAEPEYFDLPVADGSVHYSYLHSSGWVGELVLMDENYGPYYTVDARWLDRLKWAVADVVTPHGVEFLAPEAETLAVVALPDALGRVFVDEDLDAADEWTKRLFDTVGEGKAVLRTTRQDKADYIGRLAAWSADALCDLPAAVDPLLDEVFWLVEASIPELYPINQGKLADVLINQRPDGLSVAAVLLPEFLYLGIAEGAKRHGLKGWRTLEERG